MTPSHGASDAERSLEISKWVRRPTGIRPPLWWRRLHSHQEAGHGNVVDRRPQCVTLWSSTTLSGRPHKGK